MIFQLATTPYEQFNLLNISLLLSLDKNVFEDSFLSYINLLDILQHAVLLHFAACLTYA